MMREDSQEDNGNKRYRIGILSDTHGLLRPEVAEALQGCQVILHGGDINSQAVLDKLKEIAPVYAVRGNNDGEWAGQLPETISVTLFGIRFFMVHNKKGIPRDMIESGEGSADVIVYGHSHKYEEKREKGKLLINPGSCGPRRFTQPVTLAVLETDKKGSFEVRKVEIADSRERAKEREAYGKRRPEDMGRVIKRVMLDTNRGLTVDKISEKNHIDRELAEQICRLYLTHPGVSMEGILEKMGL